VFLIANLALLPAGYLAIKASGALMRVPRHTLLPVIVLFCVLGSYAIGGSYFDVGIMLGMGLLGFALERWSVPVGPVVLGIILGGPLEERFIQAMTASGGSPAVFFARPAAAALGVAALAVWLLPALGAWRTRRRRDLTGGADGQ
jgi:putative tricarboxylic transport membrane protein